MVDAESGTDPLTAPLTYPGLPPRRAAVLVTSTAVLDVLPLRAAPPGEWPVRRAGRTRWAGLAGPDTPLDCFLRDAGAPPLSQRTPVLSVGSNASPAQVRRKMTYAGLPTVLPMAAVHVHGLAVGVSAHVSRPGYVPATPVADPAAVSQLWVVWLGPEALIAMDATEPNYRRVRLPSRYPAYLTSGAFVPDCNVYLSRHGHLINSRGRATSADRPGHPHLRAAGGGSGSDDPGRGHPAGMAPQGSGRARQGGHPRPLPDGRYGADGRSAGRS